MMKRDIYGDLLSWKKADWRKPLILQGARQVGKTHILQYFGQQEYRSSVYFNFERDPALSDFFRGRIDPKRILEKLSIYAEEKILPEETLIFFDEIQASPTALKSLKYFNEECNEFHIVTAGSLLGVKIGQSAAFPVGKVNFLKLHPLSFLEFLEGTGAKNLREYLDSLSDVEPLPEPFHERLGELLRLYYFIGGMPEAVVNYLKSGDLSEVRRVQTEILMGYENDFSKYASPADAIKISALWDSIPLQLARENKKFRYAEVSRNARAREYAEALKWLLDAGLVVKSRRIDKAMLPLDAYADDDSFKLYMLDAGLLGAKLKISQRTIVLGNDLFSHFNGAFTENYVAQELQANRFSSLFYWASVHEAEVDFVVGYKEKIYPLEVKSGINAKSKSLRIYAEKFEPPCISIATLRNFKRNDNHTNFPLYGICLFPRLLHREPVDVEQLSLRGF